MSQSVIRLLSREFAKDPIWKDLERRFGFQIRSLTPVKSVVRIDSEHGSYALKGVSYRPAKLQFIIAAIEHVYQGGFTRLARILPDMQGNYYFTHNNHLLFLTPWVHGEQCEVRKPAHLTAATETLAEFHHYSRGLIPPLGSRFKVMWDRWPEVLLRRAAMLEHFKEKASTLPSSPFIRLWLKHFDYYHLQAGQALSLLKSSAYTQLADLARREQTFIHRDVAGRNFIISHDQKAYLIDFDYCRFDLRLVDVQRLIERSMKKWQWNFDVAFFIISRYHQIHPLRPEEFKVMQAFMTFPQKFWRLSDRYFNRKKNWSEGKYLRRLEAIIEDQRPREIFFTRFARCFKT